MQLSSSASITDNGIMAMDDSAMPAILPEIVSLV